MLRKILCLFGLHQIEYEDKFNSNRCHCKHCSNGFSDILYGLFEDESNPPVYLRVINFLAELKW